MRFHLSYAGGPREVCRLAATRLHADNVGTALMQAIALAGKESATPAGRAQERAAIVDCDDFRAGVRRLLDAGNQAPSAELLAAARAHAAAGERAGLRHAADVNALAAALLAALRDPTAQVLSEESLSAALYAFARLRVDCPALYTLGAEQIALQGAAELRAEALAAALWGLAVMGDDHNEGLQPLLQVLGYHWTEAPGDGALDLGRFELSHLAACAWALAVSGERRSAAFGAIWDALCALSDEIWLGGSKRELQQLWQCLTILDAMGGDEGAALCAALPPLARRGAAAAFEASDVTISSAAVDAERALSRLGIRADSEVLVATPQGYGGLRVDLLLKPRVHDDEGAPRVVVEVDGPSHFSADGARVTGPTRATTRVLRALGYRVARVGWQELMEAGDRDGQAAMLERRIRQAT